MDFVSRISTEDAASAWRIVRHREFMERLILPWLAFGLVLALAGFGLEWRLAWTIPILGYVLGVMALEYGPDYRAANYWVPVLGSQAALVLPLIAKSAI